MVGPVISMPPGPASLPVDPDGAEDGPVTPDTPSPVAKDGMDKDRDRISAAANMMPRRKHEFTLDTPDV